MCGKMGKGSHNVVPVRGLPKSRSVPYAGALRRCDLVIVANCVVLGNVSGKVECKHTGVLYIG